MKPISVSTICTKSRVKEFLVTKRTLELFHDCRWSVVCDEFTSNYFDSHENFTPVKIVNMEGRHYNSSESSANDFFELVKNKMVAMRSGIALHGYSLFLDTDLIFVSPLDDCFFNFLNDDSKTLFLTSHCHTEEHSDNRERYGTYNVGMLASKTIDFADKWIEETERLNCKYGLEQKPVTTIANEMMDQVTVADSNYNYGWWRSVISDDHSRLTSDNGKLCLDGKEIINIHAHTDPQNSRGPYEINFLNETFRKMSDSDKYGEVFDIIREVYGM